jgi:multimeric flavodoxin WrbA
MSQILGIVGSARPWGNSEILVRQALLSAKAEGVEIGMVRLTDLRLESCTGCMRCALGGRPCPLDDDMSWLIGMMQVAQGLILAAPTYFLGPAAVVKLVLDRLLMVIGHDQGAQPPAAGRASITIATAGLEDWRGISLPYLNALVNAFGFRPMESLLAVAPGPGEVLLDEPLMARVAAAGRQLAAGNLELLPLADPSAGQTGGSAPRYSGPRELLNVCPVCRCDAFVLARSMALCPICGLQAKIEMTDGQVHLRFSTEPATRTQVRQTSIPPGEGGVKAPHFQGQAGQGPTTWEGSRWTPEALHKHMSDWVQATGPRFMARRQEIKERRAPFREAAIPWLCPTGAKDEPESHG